jgi:hypothetical protein
LERSKLYKSSFITLGYATMQTGKGYLITTIHWWTNSEKRQYSGMIWAVLGRQDLGMIGAVLAPENIVLPPMRHDWGSTASCEKVLPPVRHDWGKLPLMEAGFRHDQGSCLLGGSCHISARVLIPL